MNFKGWIKLCQHFGQIVQELSLYIFVRCKFNVKLMHDVQQTSTDSNSHKHIHTHRAHRRCEILLSIQENKCDKHSLPRETCQFDERLVFESHQQRYILVSLHFAESWINSAFNINRRKCWMAMIRWGWKGARWNEHNERTEKIDWWLKENGSWLSPKTNRFGKHKWWYYHLVLSAKQFQRALKINTPTILKFYDNFDVLFVIEVHGLLKKENTNITTAAKKSLRLQCFAMRKLSVSIVNILRWMPPQSDAREYLAQCEFYIWTITRLTVLRLIKMQLLKTEHAIANSLSFEL